MTPAGLWPSELELYAKKKALKKHLKKPTICDTWSKRSHLVLLQGHPKFEPAPLPVATARNWRDNISHFETVCLLSQVSHENGMKSLSPHPIGHLNTSRPMGWSSIALHTARCLNISISNQKFMKGRQTTPIVSACLLYFDQLFQRPTVLQTKSYDGRMKRKPGE